MNFLHFTFDIIQNSVVEYISYLIKKNIKRLKHNKMYISHNYKNITITRN